MTREQLYSALLTRFDKEQIKLLAELVDYLMDRKLDGGRTMFKKPTVDELNAYVKEQGRQWKDNTNAQKFIDFYESKGWLIGKNKMKKWQNAVSGQWTIDASQVKEKRKGLVCRDCLQQVTMLMSNGKCSKCYSK